MNQIKFNQEAWNKLTPREIEIARIAAEGKTNKECGAILHIAENTVTCHRSRITEKLGASSFLQAIVMLAKGGII